VFNPVYFMGWVIQPTPHDVFAYERVDTVQAQVEHRFSTIGRAMAYVERRTKGK